MWDGRKDSGSKVGQKALGRPFSPHLIYKRRKVKRRTRARELKSNATRRSQSTKGKPSESPFQGGKLSNNDLKKRRHPGKISFWKTYLTENIDWD